MWTTFELIVILASLPLISTRRRRTSSGSRRNKDSQKFSSTLFDGVFIEKEASDWFKEADNNGELAISQSLCCNKNFVNRKIFEFERPGTNILVGNIGWQS